jgi:hypothetical protein
VLHQQVRSKERLFVWIEGADDLTQEAQAFLRRILETSAPNVTCCLEVRELWKLSPPILSRCTVVPMRINTSYRTKRNETLAFHMGIRTVSELHTEEIPDWKDIPLLRRKGEDPYILLQRLLSSYGPMNRDIQELIRAIGAGSCTLRGRGSGSTRRRGRPARGAAPGLGRCRARRTPRGSGWRRDTRCKGAMLS